MAEFTPGPAPVHFVVSGWNPFYDGWLAFILNQPQPSEAVAADGWQMGKETGGMAGVALQAEIRLGHITVEQFSTEQAAAPLMYEALRAIDICECTYRLDPLEHAHNAIEHCQALARAALAAAEGE